MKIIFDDGRCVCVFRQFFGFRMRYPRFGRVRDDKHLTSNFDTYQCSPYAILGFLVQSNSKHDFL